MTIKAALVPIMAVDAKRKVVNFMFLNLFGYEDEGGYFNYFGEYLSIWSFSLLADIFNIFP